MNFYKPKAHYINLNLDLQEIKSNQIKDYGESTDQIKSNKNYEKTSEIKDCERFLSYLFLSLCLSKIV